MPSYVLFLLSLFSIASAFPSPCTPTVYDFAGYRPGYPFAASSDGAWDLSTFSLGNSSRDCTAIFDSSIPHLRDLDLGTPGECRDGPGRGQGGQAGLPGQNCFPLGNLLVCGITSKEDCRCPDSSPCTECQPDDDYRGASFVITFNRRVFFRNITVVDLEGHEAFRVDFPNGDEQIVVGYGDNSVQKVVLDKVFYPSQSIIFTCSGSCGLAQFDMEICWKNGAPPVAATPASFLRLAESIRQLSVVESSLEPQVSAESTPEASPLSIELLLEESPFDIDAEFSSQPVESSFDFDLELSVEPVPWETPIESAPVLIFETMGPTGTPEIEVSGGAMVTVTPGLEISIQPSILPVIPTETPESSPEIPEVSPIDTPVESSPAVFDDIFLPLFSPELVDGSISPSLFPIEPIESITAPSTPSAGTDDKDANMNQSPKASNSASSRPSAASAAPSASKSSTASPSSSASKSSTASPSSSASKSSTASPSSSASSSPTGAPSASATSSISASASLSVSASPSESPIAAIPIPSQSPSSAASAKPESSCEYTSVPIDFEGRRRGSPVRGGDGYSLSTTRLGYGADDDASAIFDTSNPTSGDLDLGSPNSKCAVPGPGVGIGGEPGYEGENCEPLGNVLIAHQGDAEELRKICEKCPTCKECAPNDSWTGAQFNFTFTEKTKLLQLTMLDVDEQPRSVILTDDAGYQFEYRGFGGNGKMVIDLAGELLPVNGTFSIHCAGSCAVVELQRARCLPVPDSGAKGPYVATEAPDGYGDGDVFIPGPSSSSSPSYIREIVDDDFTSPTPSYKPASSPSQKPMEDYRSGENSPSTATQSPVGAPPPTSDIISKIDGYHDKLIEAENMPCEAVMDTFEEFVTGHAVLAGEYWRLETCRKEWNKTVTCGVSAAFNSSSPIGDADLGSPNEYCKGGGPGKGWGGSPKAAGANCKPLGQVLIAATGDVDKLRKSCPGKSCYPNDHAGGAEFRFTFNTRSRISAIAMMDLDDDPDSAAIVIGDTVTNIRGLGDNSVQIVSLKNVVVEKDGLFTIRCSSSCAIVRIDYYPCL